MEALINDLTAHNIQNRTAAIIENGSWAAASGGLIRGKLEECKNINILQSTLSIKSGLKENQLTDIDAMANAIAATMPKPQPTAPSVRNAAPESAVEPGAMLKLSYGLFVLTARDGERDNGCIINTVSQVTNTPLKITAAVNKANFTHGMVVNTGEFNVSILTESVPFRVIEQFGFSSGKGKFDGCGYDTRTANGIRYVPEYTNGVISAKVTGSLDCGTHTLFIAEVTQALVLSGEPSVTYQYYFDRIKPAPKKPENNERGFVCKICGYVYEGDKLPDGFICPLCKHGVNDFDPL
jgi:flavin reductase (DIM6/NTAB) family NADH-FMN oxidoreductase RutF